MAFGHVLRMKDDRLTKSGIQPGKDQGEDDWTKDGWIVLKRIYEFIYDEPV